MDDMKLLLEDIKREFPRTRITIMGRHMKINRPGRPLVVVEYREDKNFGIFYNLNTSTGKANQEIRIHRFSALQRVRELLD